jgi:hypothetical protein
MTEIHIAPNAPIATTTIEDLYKAFGELADAKENAGKVGICFSFYKLG